MSKKSDVYEKAFEEGKSASEKGISYSTVKPVGSELWPGSSREYDQGLQDGYREGEKKKNR